MFGLPRRPAIFMYVLVASVIVLFMVVYHQRDGEQNLLTTKVFSWWKTGTIDLTEIEEEQGGAQIFFAETSGKSRLQLREVCAVEAASRHHPHRNVTLFSIGELAKDDEALRPLLDLHNVHLATLNLNEIFDGTPLERWHQLGSISESSFPVEHLSDATRLALLWKLGGIYLDTDVICVRSFSPHLHNAVGLQQQEEANGAVLLFDRGHDFLQQCMMGYVANFSRHEWATQGPELVTRTLRATCKVEYLADVIRDPDSCEGVSLLPEDAFYPIPWTEWTRLFREGTVPPSYTIHLWGKLSRDTITQPGSGNLLDIISRDNCPSVYEIMRNRGVV